MAPRLLHRSYKIYKREGIVELSKSIKRFISNRTPSVIPHLKITYIKFNSNDGLIEKEVEGARMILRSDEAGIHQDILVSETREPASTEMFKSLLEGFSEKHGDDIFLFDIGANIGYYVLLEASLLGDQSRIVAVEPEPTNVKDLRKNVSLNDFENVDIWQKAAGSERGSVKLKVGDKSNLHSVVSEPTTNESVISVESVSVDSLVNEYDLPNQTPIVVRIDVEGYEKNVVEGMKNLLNSNNPLVIFVEIHSSKISRSEEEYIFQMLEDNGVELKFVSYDGGDTGKEKSGYSEITREFTNKHIIATRQP